MFFKDAAAPKSSVGGALTVEEILDMTADQFCALYYQAITELKDTHDLQFMSHVADKSRVYTSSLANGFTAIPGNIGFWHVPKVTFGSSFFFIFSKKGGRLWQKPVRPRKLFIGTPGPNSCGGGGAHRDGAHRDRYFQGF